MKVYKLSSNQLNFDGSSTVSVITDNTDETVYRIANKSPPYAYVDTAVSPTIVPGVTVRPMVITDDVNLSGWFDAGSISSNPADGAAVGTWNAIGPAGMSASQATASAQPLYSASGRNGYPSLVLDGGDDCFALATAGLSSDDFTLCIAAYENANAGGWKRALSYGGDASDSNSNVQIIRKGDNGKVSEINAGSADVDWEGLDHFVMLTKLGTVAKLYVDGVLKVTGSLAAVTGVTQGWIGRGLSYADNWTGQIQAVGFFNKALPDDRRQAIEGLQSWKLKKNGNDLPSGHPWKSSAPTFAGAYVEETNKAPGTGDYIFRRRRMVLGS